MSALKYWDSIAGAWKIVAPAAAGVPVGGTTNQVLSKIDGTDYNTQWSTPSVGGSPGGSTTQVQFNDAGAFGGDAAMVWDKTNHILTLAGSTTTATLKIGTLEIQDYSLGNAWLGENAIFDGAWKYRTSGSAGLFYFFGSEGQFRMFPSGIGGTALPGAGANTQLKINADGSVALGGTMGATAGDFSLAAVAIKAASTQVGIAATWPLGWSSTSGAGNTIDTALSRNAAGVVEINSGTAGTYRDLKLRNLILSGGTQIPATSPTGLFLKDDGTYGTPAGGGNVSNSGTPSAGQLASWTDATHIQGVANTLGQWTGTATGLTAATGRTSLGANTVGSNIFTLANPGAISFLKIDAANAATMESAATHRASLGLAIGTNVQAWDTDLDTWAAVVRATGFDTFTATPSSANLRALLTDENGTGAALFSGATSPDFTTGITVGGAGASRKILVGDGTRFVPSTETYAAPGTASYQMVSDGTNWTSKAYELQNVDTNPTTSALVIGNADTYLPGSKITVAAGDFVVGSTYHAFIIISKTAAGTASGPLTLRLGTAGTTADTSIAVILGAQTGTAAVDSGTMDVYATFTTVGASATVRYTVNLIHNSGTSTAGLWNTGSVWSITGGLSQSATFSSTTGTKIGLSYNGGASAAHTVYVLKAELFRP